MRPALLILAIILTSGCVCQPLTDYENITSTINPTSSGLNPAAGEPTPTTNPPEQPDVICNQPYVRFGDDCCLDRNGNGECDSIEPQPTQTTQPGASPTTIVMVPTTQKATSTTVTSTTLEAVIRCYGTSDCPENKSEVKCYRGDPYLFEELYSCVHPGSQESQCVGRIRKEIVDKCDGNEACMYGTCVELSSLSCRQACRIEGFENYYCFNSIDCQIPSHVHTPYGDENCTEPGKPYCCCYANETTGQSGSLQTTTTVRVVVSTTSTTLSSEYCGSRWFPNCAAARCPHSGHACLPAAPGVCMCVPDSSCGAWWYPYCSAGICYTPNYYCLPANGTCSCQYIPYQPTTTTMRYAGSTSTTLPVNCGWQWYPNCGNGYCPNGGFCLPIIPGSCSCVPSLVCGPYFYPSCMMGYCQPGTSCMQSGQNSCACGTSTTVSTSTTLLGVSTCYDSDGGVDIYTYGQVTVYGLDYPDFCMNSTLVAENYCTMYDGQWAVGAQSFQCPNGCLDGRCLTYPV